MPKKRKINFCIGYENLQDIHVSSKKHTLDSDEEDSDDYEKEDLCGSDIEGEEHGVSIIQDAVKITPFNMREELEEGHFDKDGQFHWNKSDDMKDNWLDNIDWVKIEKENKILKSDTENGISTEDIYDEAKLYEHILSFMVKGETIACSLRRLGKNRIKKSSVERLNLKKQGIIDENGVKIAKLTELANEILTRTGNMDIYQMTFESISKTISNIPSTSKNCARLKESAFDIYSDDFNEIENNELNKNNSSAKKPNHLLWEFKWKENDIDLQGPFNTKQMLNWSKDGYFKNGVYVRKVGTITNFYRSNRIDFDLYL